ncbi:DUF438 domain-containing protein [Facklamia miroungae]|uniref:PAC domain-containing protein n=1 Tax=Facklamia miroungae TaxID=120956 RepID=A0A1G7QLJ1_9LACT|nr:DUF438 domain-containing protein [Facklamia miroungae]NKZ28984.1 DUF438 domain-containing protein [Facklamia miroungae]SDF99345.1 hypothetical protein SAMN05421791_102133 [Facklamia miroungae]
MPQSKDKINILRDILIKLHHGADPTSVQEEFNQHFTGVSAIEISLMEQELISEGSGISFEDVMSLCNVHANLFKGSIDQNERADFELPGHPVKIFKEENIALQAAILRIKRLFEALKETDSSHWDLGLIQGLQRQMLLLGQFKKHYIRKEEILFPIMEKYGHDAPPKVMWGVDDQIRKLYDTTFELVKKLPNANIEKTIQSFRQFELEFREMIFKEEAILIQILLEIFNEDDWIAVEQASDQYGYAIIKPNERWHPQRKNFEENVKVINTVENDKIPTVLDVNNPTHQEMQIKFNSGYLSLKEIDRILDHLDLEITFVSKDDIFTYFNNQVHDHKKILPRNTNAIGRNVEKCHPPRVVEKVKTIFENLRTKKTSRETMWFSRGNFFALIIYQGVYDYNGEFMGVLETVQDIQPHFELQGQADQRNLSTERINKN